MTWRAIFARPWLLVGARRAAAPGDALGHGELTAALLEAAAAAAAAGDSGEHDGGGGIDGCGGGGGGSGGGNDPEGVGVRVRRLTVSGLGDWGDEGGGGGGGGGGGLSVFAPWEHPHVGSGCWLGVHPCQTAAVMRLLLATNDAGPSDPGLYMVAWLRLMAAAVADFPIPSSLGRGS